MCLNYKYSVQGWKRMFKKCSGPEVPSLPVPSDGFKASQLSTVVTMRGLSWIGPSCEASYSPRCHKTLFREGSPWHKWCSGQDAVYSSSMGRLGICLDSMDHPHKRQKDMAKDRKAGVCSVRGCCLTWIQSCWRHQKFLAPHCRPEL